MRFTRAPLLALVCFSSLGACEASVQSTPEAPVSGVDRVARTRGPSATGLSVPSGTVGPFLSPMGRGWLAAWAAPDPKSAQKNWLASTFDADGRPTGKPTRLAAAHSGVDLVRLRSIKGQSSLLVASHVLDSGYELTALALSARGTLLGGPSPLSETSHRIVWIDTAPTLSGAVVTWAEERDGRAHVFARGVDTTGRAVTRQVRLHSDARAWQLLSVPNGAVVGVVTVDGNVETVHLDGSATASQPLVISDQHSAEPDIDLALLGDNVIVAFSDRRVLEPHLFSAVLSTDGHMRTDVRLMRRPNGAQSLVALESGAQGTYVLWQNTAQEVAQYRIAQVDAQGKAFGRSVRLPPSKSGERDWHLGRNAIPTMATSNTGLTLLAPACTEQAGCSSQTQGASVVIELSPDLSPRSSYSWFQRAETPDLVWDFQCAAAGCAALTAYYADPTRVVVRTTDGSGHSVASPDDLQPTSADGAPFALQAIFATPELAAVASAPFDDGTLVAWLSAFDPNIVYEVPSEPAPDGRRAPVRAQLRTQWLDRTPEPRESRVDSSEERSVSIRARSVAGISLASTPTRALLTWTAIDNDRPQVFNTLLDARGRKQRQEMLTRQTGEVLDVSAIAWRTGWLVAWIREHQGQTRAYAARLGETLGRMSADVLLSAGQGLQSSIELGATKRGLFAVVAEVQAAGETLAWVQLNPNTLAPRSPNDSFTSLFGAPMGWQRSQPRLRAWGDGLALAWLEHKPEQFRVVIAQLDAEGNLLGNHQVPLLARGVALDLRCDDECHLAVTTETEPGLSPAAGALWTTTVARTTADDEQRSQALSLTRVAHLSAPTSLHVAPSVTRSGLLHFDDAAAPTFDVTDGTSSGTAVHESWINW